MKVKVTPPYDGVGSWESELVSRRPFKIAIDGEVIMAHLLKGGVQVPASWCEPISEIIPEPGDIVDAWDDDHEYGRLRVFVEKRDSAFIARGWRNSIGVPFKHCRVLARKPKGGLDAHDAIHEFFRDLSDAETASADVAAYNKFLSAILGVPYGRVG